MNNTHRFLAFGPIITQQSLVREVARALMFRCTNQALSYQRWRKQRPIAVPCYQSGNGQRPDRHWTSNPIHIVRFEEQLRRGTFDFAYFNLFDPRCDWLDSTIDMALDNQMAGSDGTVRIALPTTLGPRFPVIPSLDREGRAFNSFQLSLQDRILELRRAVVDTSHEFYSWNWFQNLRSFITECVALVDITLHQLYSKAEFAPLEHWSFSKKSLGDRYGQRVSEKVRWVHKITGKNPHIEEELRSFMVIKRIRNHLQHLDPPCFCFTMEDVSSWLNRMGDIARMLWKMRVCMGSPPSVPLIRMMFSPKVLFVPKNVAARRWPQTPEVGYASSCYAEDLDDDG